MSLCVLRTLLPRVIMMTATEARHGPILLPTVAPSAAARHAPTIEGPSPLRLPIPDLLGIGGPWTPIPIPDFKLPGIGGPPPPPPPICRRGTQHDRIGPGDHPRAHPRSHRGFRALPRAGSPAGSASGWVHAHMATGRQGPKVQLECRRPAGVCSERRAAAIALPVAKGELRVPRRAWLHSQQCHPSC